MAKLIINNNYTVVDGATALEIRALDNCMAYPVEGAKYSSAFRNKRWDGKEHLLRFEQKIGRNRFPTGLLEDAVNILTAIGNPPELEDQRVIPERHKQIKFRSTKFAERDYQTEAVDVMSDGSVIMPYRGVLHACIRSGKTLMAARIIDRLKFSTLFIVNQDMLLGQTIKSFEEAFQMEIGHVQGGTWNIKPVTVASVQTLTYENKKRGLSYRAKGRELMDSRGCLIFDEAHHATADTWREPMLESMAYSKFGLSATIKLSHKHENAAGAILLKACTGPIRHRITMTEMIRAGWLLPPDIRVFKVDGDPLRAGWPRCYERGIVNNEQRNALIADVARTAVGEFGMMVAIHTQRLEHIKNIAKFLQGSNYKLMYGDIDTATREATINAMKRREIDIVVGTIIGEGVDIPQLKCVINAEGGLDEIGTIQKMRNLTPEFGRVRPDERALYIDFADTFNEILARHSLARLSVYKQEPEFKIKVVDDIDLVEALR